MRAGYLAVAGVAYAVFFTTFLYLIGFLGDFAWLPTTVDRGLSGSAWPVAVIVDVALVALFGVQHSVMARPAFKARWTRIVPEPLERTVYVLAASVCLIVLFAGWQPVAGTLWRATGPLAMLLWALFAAGWAIVLASSFLINHFELFGLLQVYRHWRGRSAVDPRFRTPFFYKLVRHPLYSGFLLAFWATPVMTAGHALFAAAMSIYVLIAIGYEERDLVALFGRDYTAYRASTGMLVPGVGRRT